jgi:hypothetical protein
VETSHDALHLALCTIFSFATYEFKKSSAVLQLVIHAVSEKIAVNQWSNETLSIALSILSRAEEYYSSQLNRPAVAEVNHKTLMRF